MADTYCKHYTTPLGWFISNFLKTRKALFFKSLAKALLESMACLRETAHWRWSEGTLK